MELRSRSRSNTPFLQKSIDTEVSNTGNHVTKTTRRTVKTVETVSSEAKRSRRSQRGQIVTSDYSSEDGEAYVSSTDVENARNRRREESMNGNGVSALKVYKEAGEYWNKFPKTDYTYSRHSKDRIEIAPGVVAMPNMSRRSLHSNCSDVVLNKQTNTVSVKESSYCEPVSSPVTRMRWISKKLSFASSEDENYGEEFIINRRTLSEVTIIERILTVFTSIVTVILYPFTYAYQWLQPLFLWIGKAMHRTTSLVMLWDTWLLRRSSSADRKLAGVFLLCLVPLLLFGGFWAIFSLAAMVETGLTTLRGPTIDSYILPVISEDKQETTREIPKAENLYFTSGDFEARIGDIVRNIKSEQDFEIKLSDEQLKAIAEYVKKEVISSEEVIMEKILENPYIKNVVNNVQTDVRHSGESPDFDEQNLIIGDLRKEILKMREELMALNRLNMENRLETSKLSLEMKTCCRKSFVQIESYVSKILKDLFNAPSDFTSRDDTMKWLNSIFIARDDLEAKLSNLTKHLKAEYDATVENNGKLIMDRVNLKISSEFTGGAGVGKFDVGDDRVRRIVSEALEVYDADKTGLVDYALESAGGQVVSTRCTESYQLKTAVVSVLGIPIWYPANTPRTVITPGVNPGECWAFQNFPGFLIIKLSGPVKISAFTMEHLSRRLASSGKIDSAPKDFEVYGLENESDKDPALLGNYRYEQTGKPLQFFRSESSRSFNLVELRIMSNHGNPNYTCLYRFRVHGELEST